MTRRWPDLSKPLPPAPFVYRVFMAVIVLGAFAALVAVWR
jgi:hypothetical protein